MIKPAHFGPVSKFVFCIIDVILSTIASPTSTSLVDVGVGQYANSQALLGSNVFGEDKVNILNF